MGIRVLNAVGLLREREVSWRVSFVLEVELLWAQALEGHRPLTAEEHTPWHVCFDHVTSAGRPLRACCLRVSLRSLASAFSRRPLSSRVGPLLRIRSVRMRGGQRLRGAQWTLIQRTLCCIGHRIALFPQPAWPICVFQAFASAHPVPADIVCSGEEPQDPAGS